ncbi:PAS domain-containing protein [Methylobacterium radiodurans]|uniref:Histidine kinase n=1 Tax=Methylobacterium radiodurans TaxID=2202828 RepID=A0A2U8VNQ6_9HYPH|nr:PAS domain-containing protein [Methylobacterium radiodurans]AWN35016.1 histidine kinase [Methylobacterium radiodurans]
MNIIELVRLFAEPLDVAVVLTDIDLDRPGPTVLYTNPAFLRMSGYDSDEVLGRSPRMLQGPGTSREATRQIQRALRLEGRFTGFLQNYRKDGEAYLCELDVRTVRRRDGTPEAFIAFEREVVRRRGRPARGGGGRYRPIHAAALPLTENFAPLFD